MKKRCKLAVVVLLLVQANGTLVCAAQTTLPPELELYTKARSIVQMTEAEILTSYPELKGVVFDFNQDDLDSLVRKAGEKVERLFRDLPNVSFQEEVRHERRSSVAELKSGRMNRKYRYLCLRRPGGFEEVRTDMKGQPVDGRSMRNYLLTSGYAASPYFFHPSEVSASHFRYLGKEKITGAHVISFAQKPEIRECRGVFTLPKGEACLLFQGIAWVDPHTFQIIRIQTALLAPRPDFGIERQDTDVTFQEVSFDGLSAPIWLPREVVITVEYGTIVFRNRHRYSDFKVFTVESFDKLDPIRRPPQPN